MSEQKYKYEVIEPSDLQPGMDVWVDGEMEIEPFTLVEMSHPDEDTWWCRGVESGSVVYYLIFEESLFRRVELEEGA